MFRRNSECHVVGRAARLERRLALIVAGWGMGGCAGSGKDAQAAEERASADKFYEVAVGSFQNGMYSDAERNLDRALNIDDAHANALYLRGLISLVEGKDVLPAVERSSCLRAEAAELPRARARERHRTSREFFRRAAASFGEGSAGRGRALNSMAVVSLYFGDYETAVLEAEEALEEQFYAARYSALSNLGWAYYQQDRVVEAMAELREAVRMNPDHCVSRYRLAETYFRYGLADEARPSSRGSSARTPARSRRPFRSTETFSGLGEMRTPPRRPITPAPPCATFLRGGVLPRSTRSGHGGGAVM